MNESTWLPIQLAYVVASVLVSEGSVGDSHITKGLKGTDRTSHERLPTRKPRVKRRNVMAEPGGNLTDPI